MVDAPATKTFYTTTAAGQALGYSDDNIRRMCEQGHLPGAQRKGNSGHWRIPVEAIEAFRVANRPKVRRRG